MDTDDLIRLFEAGTMPEGGFHHAQHVQVAWAYLRRFPLPHALARFSDGLKRFAAAQGATGLYHETITVAFVLLINERLADEGGAGDDWNAFACRHPELLAWKPSVLDGYYSPETLSSDRARRTFVMPDRAPARKPATAG
jgi:hypothetical protein